MGLLFYAKFSIIKYLFSTDGGLLGTSILRLVYIQFKDYLLEA